MKGPCDLGTPKRREAGKEDQNYSSPNDTNKKRKSTGKNLTPRKRSSKNNTPKKNDSVSVSSDSARKIDLWLEAKLSAEENSRLFAGRQIHPFFSLWKAEKKNQEPADPERGLTVAKRKDGIIVCGPIHVFEDVQDDASPMDWRDWTFLGKTTTPDIGPESLTSSVLEGSVKSLNFDDFLRALKPSSASIYQNAVSCLDQLSIEPYNMMEISAANSAELATEQTICPLKPRVPNVDLEVDEVSTLGHKGIFRKSDTEPLSRFLQESMRSYYHSCEDKAKGSLWIHKYMPTKAFEVCGNVESLNSLRNWLRLWHERCCHGRKDSSNRDQSDMQDVDEDDDYNCSRSDYALKDINEEDSLQNVLLITGPIGSGKSAAVYACAREQGFEVLELNASDYRNGAAVKQYFGDALGSHGCKRLLNHAVSSHKKAVKFPSTSVLPNGKAAEETDDEVIELIEIFDDETHSPGGTSPRLPYDSVQTLILFEDVDIMFPEDRGCIAAIRNIALTGKGPIILTSNSNNGGLPDNFARLHLSFSLPLPHELLCHLYMICVMEEVNINPLLLEKIIQSCDGDIRKVIMQLQFWFQSEKYRKDRKTQMVYRSLPFDLEACHQIIPKILPWNFPTELSKLIENEVTELITIMQENSRLQGIVNKELDINERKNNIDMQCIGTDYLEAKVERIKRNRSHTDCNESSPSIETDMVQNMWKKLRVCRTDLRWHANSEQLDFNKVVKLTNDLTDLISQADLLFRNHQQKQCGIMEPPMSLPDEATIRWYDEQMMMSTVAVDGFSFYAKHISDVTSILGCENRVDLNSEMLASTTNIMALGKLSRQDHPKSMSIYTTKQLEVSNQTTDKKCTSLVNVIQSIIPTRLSLEMKGLAFNEYLSSLRQISMSEGFRISQGVGKMRKRRMRGAQHYLSRGKMVLSPEDISLVCEGDLYRKISSQYTANMENTCT